MSQETPMLAAQIQLAEVQFGDAGIFASAKIDGVRAAVRTGRLTSRSLKVIPNPFIRKAFEHSFLEGLDGEIIVGDPVAKDVFRKTSGACNNESLKPNGTVRFYVFDDFSNPLLPFSSRIKRAAEKCERAQKLGINVVLLEQKLVFDSASLLAFEEQCLAHGYEGLILRHPLKPYKNGRSTTREAGMLKLKRFIDSEAMIIGMEEEMSNTNAAQTNALGRTERSTAKDGMVAKGRMGALICRDLNSKVEFNIGTGFDMKDRELFWQHREKIIGSTVVKYKSFPVGVKDKPRFPVYLGVRNMWDMS
jgi:DNA ligase-1